MMAVIWNSVTISNDNLDHGVDSAPKLVGNGFMTIMNLKSIKDLSLKLVLDVTVHLQSLFIVKSCIF